MLETAVFAHAFRKHFFAGMPERRMPEVVRKRDGFGQVFIKAQGPRDSAANRRDFDGVGEARAQMIARAVEKNLGLVLETTKCARMNNPSPIALELGPIGVRWLGKLSAARFG